jgi:hypothetical protein
MTPVPRPGATGFPAGNFAIAVLPRARKGYFML